MQALVLLSGGLDSTVCATLAVQRHGPENIVALSVSYGQKHDLWEKEASGQVGRALQINTRLHMHLDNIFAYSASRLLASGGDIPNISYAEIEGISPTFVPYRNGTLLSVAAVIALGDDCSEIWFGAHAEDAAGWAYPDCTSEFNGSQAAAIYIGTYHKVRLIVPLQHLWKRDIVKLGLEIGAPLHLTRSCYTDHELSCGKCPTCLSRLAAFEANGMEDPIAYQA